MALKNYNLVNTNVGKLSKSCVIKNQPPPTLICEKRRSESKEKRYMKRKDEKMGAKQKREMEKYLKLTSRLPIKMTA